MLKGESEFRVDSDGENFVKLSRRGHLMDWLFPHRVPSFGTLASTGFWGSPCHAEASGIYAKLTTEDGRNTIRTLKPQHQWTGRLWNIVQWLLENHGHGGYGAEGQAFNIMGP